MGKSKVILEGETPQQKIESLFKQCSNNNQICYHIKKNNELVSFLENETNLKDKRPVVVLLYHYKNNIKHIPKCICGKYRKYHCDGYRPTCTDKKCQSIVREKSKREFCLNNYGVEFVTQLDSMKEKSKKTLLDRYGVDNITKLPEIIKRRKSNNLKKWGVEDPISLNIIRGKVKTDSERGLESIQDGLPNGYKVLESDKFYYYKLSCECGHIFEISKSVLYLRKKNNIEICNECNTSIGSNGEQEVFDYISSIYNGSISRSNRRLISPYEIDMVLEDIKLCIEFNGDYWHSIKVNNDKFYHFSKLEMCLEKGYDLFQIRENDWNKNNEDIRRKLFNKINNIYDPRDLNIDDEFLKFDMSWYDSRIIEGLDNILYENIEPEIIEVGKELQWNCGYKLFKIF
jgi:very-short-patch-repair endonuclease